MQKKEVLRFLKMRGYSLLKNGKKHQLWSNGSHAFTLSHGKYVENRLFKKIKNDVRRGCSRLYCQEQEC